MKVSVFMVTYNHEAFIAQAIESIVSQKANFDFELVIGEDCSTDNTLSICRRYEEKFPKRIKLLPSDKNHGPLGNTIRTLKACNGDYIAFCEGDDYWIDPYKLQKQVDFLDTNPDFAVCFSDVTIIDEIGDCRDDKYPRKSGDVYTIDDIILTERNIIPTPAMILRNVLPAHFPDFLVKRYICVDICLQLLAADKGKIKYFPEKMAAYRHHPGGITKVESFKMESDEGLFNTFVDANAYFNFKYDKPFRKRLLAASKVGLIFGSKFLKGKTRTKNIYRQFRRYLFYSDRVNLKEIAYYTAILFFPGILKKMKKG